MKAKLLLVFVLLASVALATTANANWSDDFESYAAGSGIIGQGGWEGWGGNPAWDAIVTDYISHGGLNSLAVTPVSDVIQQFSGYTIGTVLISAWQYIPSTATGEQYFILLDSYDHGGSTNHWALQLNFANGIVENQFEGSLLPLITDQWVELTVEIDLSLDLMTVEYDGVELVSKPWTSGVNDDYMGALNIACLDLFSNGGDEIYWDDLTLTWGVTATEDTSWSEVKSLY